VKIVLSSKCFTLNEANNSVHAWRSRTPDGVRCAYFPSVIITAIIDQKQCAHFHVIATTIDQKQQLVKLLNKRESCIPRSRTNQ
jgi:hypothetical protein